MILQSLQIHLENLIFSESMISIVEKTQALLSKHVLALKYGGKLLKEQTKKLVESSIKTRDMTDVKNEWR